DRVLEALRVAVDLAEDRRRGRREGRVRGSGGTFELRVLVVGRVVLREDPVLRRELGEAGVVLRAKRGVALERADGLLRALLLLVRGREVAPGVRVLRLLRDLLLEAADRGAAARGA